MAEIIEASTTRAALNQTDTLVAAGWTREDHGTSFTLHRTGDDAVVLADAMRSVAAVAADGRLRSTWAGGAQIELQLVDGDLVVATTSSSGDLDDVFADAQLTTARRAWDGDAAAALHLAGSWSATIAIDPAKLLRTALRDWAVHVVADAPSAAAFIRRPWWTLGDVLSSERPTLILTWREQREFQIATPALVVCPLGRTPEPPATSSAGSTWGLAGAADPRPLAPTSVTGSPDVVDGVTEMLWRLCAAASWAGLATKVAPLDDRAAARVEFFGFQRVEHMLPAHGPHGISIAACRAALDLWLWAVAGEGPDHLLAVRQVVSLYRDDAPWNRAEDVRLAAEPVFLALRADAVAEGFRVQRESRALALAIARQTADATTALAKGAVERCLAALGAIGAIIVARTSTNLTEAQAAHLRGLLGVFLLVLAAWSIFIEGPPATAPMRGLKDDIDKLSPLLPAGEQRAILDLTSVRNSKRHAQVVRVVVPMSYVAAAIAAFAVR